MEFLVSTVDMQQGLGRWVLAVDPVGERLLVADDDQSLFWLPIAECKFLAAATPEHPRPVVVVPPEGGQQIVVPGNFPNRQMRRNGNL